MNLNELALKHGSDKYGHHNYTPIYETYFNKFKDEEFTFLEIGVGGYEYSDKGGNSLRMWLDYFSKAKIVGVDLHKKELELDIHRCQIYQGDQTDEELFKSIFKHHSNPSIIIDDASHINRLSIQSFKRLWKYLKSGGLYVIEDTHTSVWHDNFEGTQEIENLCLKNRFKSVQNFFKRMTDYLNLEVLDEKNKNDIGLYFNMGENQQEEILEQLDKVHSIHFYKECIIILKK